MTDEQGWIRSTNRNEMSEKKSCAQKITFILMEWNRNEKYPNFDGRKKT